jgi:C-terminal processing protease CtpA/Prc
MKITNQPRWQFVTKHLRLSLTVIATSLFVTTIFAQTSITPIERGRAKDMLNAVKNQIKDNYYDKTFHGINLDERFKIAEEKLDKAASNSQAFGIIAQAVMELDDSHTTFYPPARASFVYYNWRMQMIGDKCFVTSIKPNSDAEKVGLKVGDEVVKVEGFKPTRKDLWKMNYYFNALSPRGGLNVFVKSPSEKEPRELNVPAKVVQLKAAKTVGDLLRESDVRSGGTVENHFLQVGNTSYWKMPSFGINPDSVDGFMNNVKNSENLILDLRDNGGGLVVTLEQLAGYFVDKDTKIADLKGRKEMKPQMAKTKGNNVYKGKLIVLINSNSGSASEIFARFIQLEKRGVVMGDVSAGAVMQSIGVPMKSNAGIDTEIWYWMSMTNADVIMSDGKSIEHVGVTPQLILIPTGGDLAAKLDPVLSTAFKLFGQTVTPEKAGSIYKEKWEEIYHAE